MEYEELIEKIKINVIEDTLCELLKAFQLKVVL